MSKNREEDLEAPEENVWDDCAADLNVERSCKSYLARCCQIVMNNMAMKLGNDSRRAGT